MFGFFNKAKQIKMLTGLLLSQNNILQDLVNILRNMDKRQETSGTIPETICGEWSSKDLGICLSIRKDKNNYYASIRDLDSLSGNFRESFPIRTDKGSCYFTLDSYAIFMEYDLDNNRIHLYGNLSLVGIAADMASYPVIPFDTNHN